MWPETKTGQFAKKTLEGKHVFVQNNVYPHVAGKRFALMITDVWFLIRASPTMTVEQAKFVGGQ